VERQGGKVWWVRKRKGQAGKKRQVWRDKEEKAGGIGRERDRQGRRDRCGETRACNTRFLNIIFDSAEIFDNISAYAQPAMKSIPCMLSQR
jgi:hypothetical protein